MMTKKTKYQTRYRNTLCDTIFRRKTQKYIYPMIIIIQITCCTCTRTRKDEREMSYVVRAASKLFPFLNTLDVI